jgi:hypothetical protein
MYRILLAAGAAGVLLVGCSESEPLAPTAELTDPSSFDLARTSWPSAEEPGVPAYARIEGSPPHVYHDDEWAAIVFYRNPACVPPAFNLLTFFDVPAAFGCQLTVEGNMVHQAGATGEPPRMVVARGTGAVPVWFVPLASIQPALEDGVLTIGELAGLSGLLTGHADHFNEVLQPSQGNHPNPNLIVNARGELEDGRMFSLQVIAGAGVDEVKTVLIRFQ